MAATTHITTVAIHAIRESGTALFCRQMADFESAGRSGHRHAVI